MYELTGTRTANSITAGSPHVNGLSADTDIRMIGLGQGHQIEFTIPENFPILTQNSLPAYVVTLRENFWTGGDNDCPPLDLVITAIRANGGAILEKTIALPNFIGRNPDDPDVIIYNSDDYRTSVMYQIMKGILSDTDVTIHSDETIPDDFGPATQGDTSDLFLRFVSDSNISFIVQIMKI